MSRDNSSDNSRIPVISDIADFFGGLFSQAKASANGYDEIGGGNSAGSSQQYGQAAAGNQSGGYQQGGGYQSGGGSGGPGNR